MDHLHVNKALVGILTDDKPWLYILTHKPVSGNISFPSYIVDGQRIPERKFDDTLIKCYHRYKYDETTQTLHFEMQPDEISYSICLPNAYTSKYPSDVRCYFGHMINDTWEYGLTEEVKAKERFLKRNDWSDTLTLERFKSFYYFKYYRNFYLIISDDYIFDNGIPVWNFNQ